MKEGRDLELRAIASSKKDELISSWFYEIGSWDCDIEDEYLTIEELEWIWEQCCLSGGNNMMYIVVKAPSIPQFQEKVEGYLRRGWSLQGGIARCSSSIPTNYLQALIKEKD